MKIGLLGAHGTGKTTLALKLAAEYKQNHPEKRVGLLTDTARKCPFQLNQNTTFEGQLWIWHAQFNAELEMFARNEILICDRTVFDNLVYSKHAGFNNLCDDCFYIALNWLETYDYLYWLRPKHNLVGDGFREIDSQFQRDIDMLFEAWISTYHIDVIQNPIVI